MDLNFAKGLDGTCKLERGPAAMDEAPLRRGQPRIQLEQHYQRRGEAGHDFRKRQRPKVPRRVPQCNPINGIFSNLLCAPDLFAYPIIGSYCITIIINKVVAVMVDVS